MIRDPRAIHTPSLKDKDKEPSRGVSKFGAQSPRLTRKRSHCWHSREPMLWKGQRRQAASCPEELRWGACHQSRVIGGNVTWSKCLFLTPKIQQTPSLGQIRCADTHTAVTQQSKPDTGHVLFPPALPMYPECFLCSLYGPLPLCTETPSHSQW